MRKNVVFIFSAAYGHLVKTLLLARFYADKGYAVHYAIVGENQALEPLLPGTIHRMKAPPFGLTHEAYDDSQPPVRLSWWKELLARHSGTHYHRRKAEVEQLISDLDPSLIFLDEFCVTDFIILYPHLSSRRCIVLSPFPPLLPNDTISPFHEFAGPGKAATQHWSRLLRLKRLNRIRDYVKFFGSSRVAIVKKRFREQCLPGMFKPSFIFNTVTFFDVLEKWYCVAEELDFKSQKLPDGHRYMGAMLNMNRAEQLSPQYQLFLKLAISQPASQIVYCSLGTVSSSIISDSTRLVDFYTKLIEIAEACPNLYFLIKTDSRLTNQLKTRALNCMFIGFAPQLDILKRASVFITHAGGNSIVEAIWEKVPMLAVLTSDKWEHNGQAARIVYHQLGIKANLTDSAKQLRKAIIALMNNELYQKNVQVMSQTIRKKYHSDYLNEVDMPG